MKVLNSGIDLDSFFDRLKTAPQRTLLMDYDGTLAPFQVDPSRAVPYPGVREMLNRLLDLTDIKVAIITGRWTKDLLPLLQLKKDLEIWGSHGIERLKSDGSYEIEPMDEESLYGLVTADEWIEKVGLAAYCEKKPGAMAIHWRGLDETEVSNIRRKVESKLSVIVEGWGLTVHRFDGGVELRVPGRDKGDAVKTVLKEMEDGAVAAYFGDDLTDEEAFQAIKGRGLGILVREESRPTAADVWIKPPEELLSFLSGLMS
jgi:trehalose-phosphatase